MGDSRIVGSDGGGGGRHRAPMSPGEIDKRMKEFKHVPANVYESKEIRKICKQMRESLGVCQCPKGSRCVIGQCSLRGQQVECSAQTCSRACTNLGGHNIPRLYIDFSRIAGTGLFTDEAVEKGQEIGRYDGKIVNPEEKKRLEQRRGAAACSYFIEHKPAPTLLYIDGFEYGTLMRFANHCCQPNCAIEQWTRDGLPVTKVVAKKNMQAGKKELTIDYGSDFFTGDVTCQCGAPNCRKVAVPSTGRTQMQVSAGDRESDPLEFRFQAEGAVGLI
jgi:SET domain-containing protein